MTQAASAGGSAVARKARDWKDPVGRLGLLGRGVLATVVGLLAIRIALGEKDEAATSEGPWPEWRTSRSEVPLMALSVSLFAVAAWRLLDALKSIAFDPSRSRSRAR